MVLQPEQLPIIGDDQNNAMMDNHGINNHGLKTAAILPDGSRDEMNLAEFPLAVLSSRSNPNIKTLEFADTQRLKTGELIERKWIITGADKFGLPTSTDDDVVLGLMQLTKDQGFRNRKVYFTRYELLKALRWSTEGRSYSRLTKSLDRLSGVRIRASNAFYDNSTKAYQTVNFGLIDAYEINDSRGGLDRDQPRSFFIWSEKLFESFKSGFIKKLDLDLYFTLRSAVSRRMYRYLDKHTYYRSTIERHLMSFAFDKLGLSRTNKFVSSVKQQVEPACEELKAVGYLESYEFYGVGKDTFVRFRVARNSGKNSGENFVEKTGSKPQRIQTKSSLIAGNDSEASAFNVRGVEDNYLPNCDVSSIKFDLIAKGITEAQVDYLLRSKQPNELERIRLIIDFFNSDKFKDSSSSRKANARNPIGLLYRAVESPSTFILPNEAYSERVDNRSKISPRISPHTPPYNPSQSEATRNISYHNISTKNSSRPELKVVTASTISGNESSPKKSKDEGNKSPQRENFKAYERFLNLEIAKAKANMTAVELTDLFSKVQQKMACLSSVISSENLRQSTEVCFEEEIRKAAKIPDFRTWLKGMPNSQI